MSVLLSSPSVDPNNLAPKGTVINAETAAVRPSRALQQGTFAHVPTCLTVLSSTLGEESSGTGRQKATDAMQHFFTLMCPAQDSRAAVRVPFTQIVPTVVKVVDTSNEGSSGAGWTIGEGGLVRRLSRPLDPLPMFKCSTSNFSSGHAAAGL